MVLWRRETRSKHGLSFAETAVPEPILLVKYPSLSMNLLAYGSRPEHDSSGHAAEGHSDAVPGH